MRAEKQLLLDEVKEKIKEANGFIIAGYTDFSAARSREFRDQVNAVGGEFEVVRKRVFLKAAEDQGITLDGGTLHGHIGVIFAHEEVTAVAKSAVNYGEKNGKSIAVLGGLIEGEVCSAQEVEAIAKLPSLNELRAQLVGLFAAPMTQVVGTLQAALTGVIHCIDQKSTKE